MPARTTGHSRILKVRVTIWLMAGRDYTGFSSHFVWGRAYRLLPLKVRFTVSTSVEQPEYHRDADSIS